MAADSLTPSSNQIRDDLYAYAPLLDGGGCLLLVGITDVGWEYLKQEGGNVLQASPPSGEFSNVTGVWIVRGKDKQEIRAMLQTVAKQQGITLTEAH